MNLTEFKMNIGQGMEQKSISLHTKILWSVRLKLRLVISKHNTTLSLYKYLKLGVF